MAYNKQKLNKRQDEILAILAKKSPFSTSQMLKKISIVFGSVSRITLVRDLNELLGLNFISKSGKGRSVRYSLSDHYRLIEPINVEKYFALGEDQRIGKEKFNFEIFSLLGDFFTEAEKKQLAELNKKYRNNLQKFSTEMAAKEFERLIIELSWKSSQIEGNTYTLLETEVLIREHQEANGHKKEEAVMILNHKKALDYIMKNQKTFRQISVSKIEDIHNLLTSGLGISKNLRKRPVGIVGTKYKPLDNQFQIKEALEKTCELVNREKNPFAKALLLSIMIAYIQPFEDGNKRTSRMISNAALLARNICPLSYRSVDEVEYKKAVILFYEKNNLSYFKQLLIEQFEFAVKNYFSA
ncbi:MAG: Fic family protein [Candidatus Moranbacteria bacterium]|nr:Fic family protein [Candidatus Moranbacteria bacterium]